MKDQKHCQQSSAFLAYAFGKEIRFLHLDGYLHDPPYEAIGSSSPAVGLDFDYEEQLIFFTLLSKSIMRVHFNGTGLTEIKINSKFECSLRELSVGAQCLILIPVTCHCNTCDHSSRFASHSNRSRTAFTTERFKR